jgi:hypothetical protein
MKFSSPFLSTLHVLCVAKTKQYHVTCSKPKHKPTPIHPVSPFGFFGDESTAIPKKLP